MSEQKLELHTNKKGDIAEECETTQLKKKIEEWVDMKYEYAYVENFKAPSDPWKERSLCWVSHNGRKAPGIPPIKIPVSIMAALLSVLRWWHPVTDTIFRQTTYMNSKTGQVLAGPSHWVKFEELQTRLENEHIWHNRSEMGFTTST